MSAAAVLAGLRRVFCPPQWALCTEVRSSSGGQVEGLRIADAIAVDLWAGRGAWDAVGFEIKASPGDLARELAHPSKSQPIRRFCSRWYIAVPAPRKNVIRDLGQLPESWGVLECGTGDPVVIRESEEVAVQEPPLDFVKAILGSAIRSAAPLGPEGAVPTLEGARLVAITRPTLSRSHVGLACGHTARRPLTKTLPARLPCLACAEGEPADRDVVLAAIADAPLKDLEAFEQALHGRSKSAQGWH